MMHPHTELGFVNESIGYGVFATQFIPKGTMTWILDELDRTFDESYISSCSELIKEKLIKYSYRDRQGQYILCWDIARFVNHSFNANCLSTAYEFEIAIRDIYPGEQLTDDYGYLNVEEPFDCLKEEGSSRTKVMPDDILYFHKEWDQKVAEAIKYFNNVEQPLKNLMDSKVIDKVNAIVEGKAQLDSILCCYYDQKKKVKL